MGEKLNFIIASLDLNLSVGFSPADAWNRAVEYYAAVYHKVYTVLPQCPHGNNLADWTGEALAPSCGCRLHTIKMGEGTNNMSTVLVGSLDEDCE